MATNRLKFLKIFDLPSDTSLSIEQIAELSRMPKSALQEVYNRGIGAHKTNPLSVRMKGTFQKGVKAPMSMKLSKEAWAFGRVYAFVMGTKKVFEGADKDIVGKYKLGY